MEVLTQTESIAASPAVTSPRVADTKVDINSDDTALIKPTAAKRSLPIIPKAEERAVPKALRPFELLPVANNAKPSTVAVKAIAVFSAANPRLTPVDFMESRKGLVAVFKKSSFKLFL